MPINQNLLRLVLIVVSTRTKIILMLVTTSLFAEAPKDIEYVTCDLLVVILIIDQNCTPILPRKEVIHPQLPLRMPCYDFTLITNPTVVPDLTQGLLVLPALLV